MATEEWTISTVTDDTRTKGLLWFNLDVTDGNMTGQVTEFPINNEGTVIGDPVVLSTTVTGTDVPIKNSGLSLMILNFTWRTCRVTMAGTKFPTDTGKQFRGRFSSYLAGEVAKTAAAAAAAETGVGDSSNSTFTTYTPADGDTGTGTGTQT